MFTLALVAATTPHAPVDMSCLPPSIPTIPTCHGETGLTVEILGKPRKVVLMILFSFEVDTLEISLREQLDLVDKVFLVESTVTNKGV